MIWKEFRALLPVWLATAAAMIASASDAYGVRGIGLPAYFFGGAILGALSIGHEYSHRTLSALLCQPIDRRRVLVVKLGVLAAMLVALLGVAVVTTDLAGGQEFFGIAIFWQPILIGLFVAPWLTMVSRTPVGGAVFTVAIVCLLLFAGQWLGVRRHGYVVAADGFLRTSLWWAFVALSSLGAAMTWWTFQRLQIADGTGLDIRVRPGHAGAPTAAFTKRNAVWLLLRKELQLQQLPLVLALVYAASYLVLAALDSPAHTRDDVVAAGTVLYAGILAMLIGALASAEERQLGTHEWQQLMPMAAWQQWGVKAGTAIGLALVLGLALPLLLVSVLPPESAPWARRVWPFRQPVAFVLVAIVTTGSLYVSSVTRSGLWALTLSIPVAVGTAMFFASVARPIEEAVHAAGLLTTMRLSMPALAGNAIFIVVLATLLGMVLRFGLANHRSSEHSVSRTVLQVTWMAVWSVVGLAAVLVLGAI